MICMIKEVIQLNTEKILRTTNFFQRKVDTCIAENYTQNTSLNKHILIYLETHVRPHARTHTQQTQQKEFGIKKCYGNDES